MVEPLIKSDDGTQNRVDEEWIKTLSEGAMYKKIEWKNSSALVYFSLEYLSENEGKIFLMSKALTSIFSAFMISGSTIGIHFS